MFYYLCAFFFEQNQLRSRALKVAWSHLTLRKIKQAYWTAVALSQHLYVIASVAETGLQTSISSQSTAACIREASDVFIQRAASVVSSPVAPAFILLDSSESAFPGTIFNAAPPGVPVEWLSQQLH